MKKKFLCLLICLIVITGCKSGKFNEENVNKEKNTFEEDYVSLSFADIYDVIGNGITNERILN